MIDQYTTKLFPFVFNTVPMDQFKPFQFQQELYHTKVERFCQLAATTLVVYDYVITFKYEVQFFWQKRWTFGKAIFLWSRYFGLAWMTINATVFMQEHPSSNLCFGFFRYQDVGAMLVLLTTHIILELRLYALYGNSKKLLAFFVLLLLAEIGIGVYLFEYPFKGVVATNNPYPNVYICADGDPPGKHVIAFFPTSSLAVETILLSLALYKAYQSYSFGYGGFIEVLTRDSVRYFLVIFTIYLATAIIWFVNNLTLNESLTGFWGGIPNIFVNRLLINIRLAYYTKNDHLPGQTPTLSTFRSSAMSRMRWRGQGTTRGLAHTSTTMEVMEMQTFSERRGF